MLKVLSYLKALILIILLISSGLKRQLFPLSLRKRENKPGRQIVNMYRYLCPDDKLVARYISTAVVLSRQQINLTKRRIFFYFPLSFQVDLCKFHSQIHTCLLRSSIY